MTGLQFFVLLGIGGIHAGFMIAEMIPWSFPFLLSKLSKEEQWTVAQRTLVGNIVKNAGVYNGILAAGLLFSALYGDREIARVLLAGVTIAGAFCAVTLSPLAALQALLGVIGLALV